MEHNENYLITIYFFIIFFIISLFLINLLLCPYEKMSYINFKEFLKKNEKLTPLKLNKKIVKKLKVDKNTAYMLMYFYFTNQNTKCYEKYYKKYSHKHLF